MFLTCLLVLTYLSVVEVTVYFTHYLIRRICQTSDSSFYLGIIERMYDIGVIYGGYNFGNLIGVNKVVNVFLTLSLLSFYIIRLFTDLPGTLSQKEIKHGQRQAIQYGTYYNLGFCFDAMDQFLGTFRYDDNLTMRGFRGPFGWLASQFHLIQKGPIEYSRWLDGHFNLDCETISSKRYPLRIAWGKGWGVRLRSAEDVSEVIGSNAAKHGLSPHPGTVELIANALPAMSLALTDAWGPTRVRIASMTQSASIRYTELFRRSIENRLITLWNTAAELRRNVDIVEDMTPLVSEIAFEHFLGLSDIPDQVHHALKDVFADVRDKVLNPLWVLIGGRPRYRKQRRLVSNFIRDNIHRGLRDGSLGSVSVNTNGEKAAVEEILALSVASTENTIILIAWTLYELAVRSDLQDQIASSDTDSTLLRNAIMESLRLYPPAYIVVEHVANTVELPSGYTIPGGSAVILPVLDLQRDPQYWQNDASSFKPERWETKEGPALSVFGGGPHQCPGRGLAQFEARHVVHAIVKHFRLTRNNDEKPTFDPGLTLRPARPLILTLTKRV